MPCRGLPSLVTDNEEVSFERFSLRDFAASKGKGARLVIDGTALLYYLHSKTEWSFGGETDYLRQATLAFCATLNRIGLSVLVLFDGTVSHSNVAGGLRKSSEKVHKFDALMGKFEADPSMHVSRRSSAPCLFPLAQEVVIEALHSCGVKVKVCEAECSRYVHGVAANNNVMLVGYDSNYLCMADVPGYIYCDSIQATHSGDVVANMIQPAKFAEHFFGAKNPERARLLSCVLGNDVAPEWAFTRFYRHLVEDVTTADTNRPAVVAAVAAWIAEHPEDMTIEQIFEKVIELELTDLPAEKVPEGEADRLAAQVAEFRAAQAAGTATDANTGAEESGFVAYLAASAEEKAELLRGFLARSEELFTPLSLSSRLTREQEFYRAATGHSRLEGVSAAYFAGDFPAQLMSVLISGMAWFRPFLENGKAPHSAVVLSQPLRAAAYAIILGNGSGAAPSRMAADAAAPQHVREAYRNGKDYSLNEVEPVWTLPDGTPLPAYGKAKKMSSGKRRDMLFNIIGLTPAQKLSVMEMPESWHAFALALIYMLNHGAAPTWWPIALCESMFAPPALTSMQSLHAHSQMSRTPEDLHRAAQWQFVLISMSMLVAALHGPIPMGSALAAKCPVDLAAFAAKTYAEPARELCLGRLFSGMALAAASHEVSAGRGMFLRNRHLISKDATIVSMLKGSDDGFARRTATPLTTTQLDAMERTRELALGIMREGDELDSLVFPSKEQLALAEQNKNRRAAAEAKKAAARSSRATVRRGGNLFANLDLA